jgi:hypothetical protein
MALSPYILDCIEKGICHHCKQPVLEGQPRYTITECHYDCHAKEEKALDQALDDFPNRLKRTLDAISNLKKDWGQN